MDEADDVNEDERKDQVEIGITLKAKIIELREEVEVRSALDPVPTTIRTKLKILCLTLGILSTVLRVLSRVRGCPTSHIRTV